MRCTSEYTVIIINAANCSETAPNRSVEHRTVSWFVQGAGFRGNATATSTNALSQNLQLLAPHKTPEHESAEMATGLSFSARRFHFLSKNHSTHARGGPTPTRIY